MAKRDYYEVLGISRSSSADEIKRAHRKLVRQYHPDVNRNNPAASEKFKEVQEAYDVLSDAEKKKVYDQFGHAGPMPSGGDPFGGRARGGRPGARTTWQSAPGGATVEDFDFDGGGIADIFAEMFGGGARSRSRPGAGPRARAEAPKGADVEYPVELTFDQAARGTTLNLQINRGGKMETIEVKVPAGVKDGSRVRIRGRGEQTGGAPGDLFIVTTVAEHPYFKRDGLDILLELPISLYEAIAGTKVSVPTLDGPVTLTIPPGTSSHAKLRIKDRGVTRGTEKGDQLVIVRVIIPRDLSEADKATIAKMGEKHPLNARADVKW